MLGSVIGDLDPVAGAGGAPPVIPPVTIGPAPVAGDTADSVVQANLVSHFQFLIPNGWFHSANRDALLTGIANAFTLIYSLFAYLRLQMRLTTATDGNLDMTAGDFFGGNLMRRTNQSDTSYRALIIANILRHKVTRPAMVSALLQLTGRLPIIFEPLRPLDTGVYGGPGLGYGVAGGYGSFAYPFQCFITAFRPKGSGIPNIAGYGVPTGAYSTPSQTEWASLSAIQDSVADADINSVINSVRPAATRVWARIFS